jgi:hypothetical protein
MNEYETIEFKKSLVEDGGQGIQTLAKLGAPVTGEVERLLSILSVGALGGLRPNSLTNAECRYLEP